MSDFQDEQGLGELPADLQNQYLQQFAPTPGGQAATLSIPASPPSNLTGDSPKYPVSVDSVFQTLPINAVDFVLNGGENIASDQVTSSGIAGVSTLLYTTDSSHVDVIKKLKWDVSPRRYFMTTTSQINPRGILTVSVGGIVVGRVSNINVGDSGEIDLNIIAGLNSQVKVILDFRNTYGVIPSIVVGANFYAPFCFTELRGYSLLSRGLPSNFEIAS